jgi:hypothetical protein
MSHRLRTCRSGRVKRSSRAARWEERWSRCGSGNGRSAPVVSLDHVISRRQTEPLIVLSQVHSLAALLSWMQDLFSAQPPVYARPPTTPTTPVQSSFAATRPQSPGQPPPRPAPPGQPRVNGSYVEPNANGTGSPPGVPVRPRQLVMPGLGGYGDPAQSSGRSEVRVALVSV